MSLEVGILASAAAAAGVSLASAIAGYIRFGKKTGRKRERSLDVQLDDGKFYHLDVDINDADYPKLKEAIEHAGRVLEADPDDSTRRPG